MRRLLAILTLLVVPCLATVTLPSVGRADVLFNQLDCSGGKNNPEAPNSSAVCQEQGNTSDPVSGSTGIIIKIVNLVAVVAGIAAVVIIVLAGLRMVTSGGSAEDVAGARRSLIYTVVGLVVLVIARTLVVYTLNRL